MTDSPPRRRHGDGLGNVLAQTSRLLFVPGRDSLRRRCAAVLVRAVRTFAVMSTDRAVAGVRAAFDAALAQGNRSLADIRALFRDSRADLRAPAEVIARWASTPVDLERFANADSAPAEDDRELWDLLVSLTRDTTSLRIAAKGQSRTRGERLASIGTAWAAAGVAGAADGLVGSPLPSVLGTLGVFFGWVHADGELADALLQAYRGLAATAIYSAAKDLATAARRAPEQAEAAR